MFSSLVAFAFTIGHAPQTQPNIVVSDPGVPKITWAGPRAVNVLGFHMLLNGFRAGGQYSKVQGPIKDFDSKAYRYDDCIAGITLPGMSSGDAEMWVAAFAAADSGDSKAGVRFMPYLKVTSYDSSSGVASFDAGAGAMTPDFFKGDDVLVCQEAGLFSFKVIAATGNGATSITLPAGLHLSSGDYLLPAPMTTAATKLDYKYLHSFKMDYSPSIAGNPSEWRNFTFADNTTYSYTGTPHKEVFNSLGNYRTPSKWRELDFRDYVSPLATGVIGSALVKRTSRSSAIGDAYIFLATDQSYHMIVEIGLNRQASTAGLMSQFSAGFGAKQSLWTGVNGPDNESPQSATDSDVVGAVTILGWIEN